MASLPNHTFEHGNLVGEVILFFEKRCAMVLWVCGYSESKLKILL